MWKQFSVGILSSNSCFLFCSSSSAMGVTSRMKEKKSREKGVVNRKRLEQQHTENKKAGDNEPHKTVSN